MENSKDPNHCLHSNIFTSIQIADRLGVHLIYGSNFEDFRVLCESQPQKGTISPAFDPNLSQLDESNAIWIVGLGPGGEVVHTQTLKLIDLKQTTLRQHFTTSFQDYRIGGYNLDVANSRWYLTREAAAITGRFTYHGELWIKGGPDGFRGGCLATILTRLMLMMGLLHWSPHYMIGLQAALTTCRGLGIREGYMRAEQRSILWKHFDDETLFEEWMVWMSREEAEFNLRIPPNTFFKLLEKPRTANKPLSVTAKKAA